MGLYLEKNFRDNEQPFFNSYVFFSVPQTVSMDPTIRNV